MDTPGGDSGDRSRGRNGTSLAGLLLTPTGPTDIVSIVNESLLHWLDQVPRLQSDHLRRAVR